VRRAVLARLDALARARPRVSGLEEHRADLVQGQTAEQGADRFFGPALVPSVSEKQAWLLEVPGRLQRERQKQRLRDVAQQAHQVVQGPRPEQQVALSA
jgi:hypothetical protein